MVIYYKIKWFLIMLFSLVVSPLWIIGAALWEIRDEIPDFYKHVFLGITFQLDDKGKMKK